MWPSARVNHVKITNVGSLEANSPVMISDVVGSISRTNTKGCHADIEVSIRPGMTVPANTVAAIG